MKAIILDQPRHFRRIELDEPAAPGPGEALVAVHRIGICGTDLSGYLGKMPFFQYPRIPGHELGVEVVAVGDGVTNIKPGDRCSVEPYMNCGECFACRRGASNCCEKLKVIGVMSDGGMRERFVLWADKLHPSAKLSMDQLALVETLAIGCHAVDRAAPLRGDHLLVIGAGPIGLASIEFARLAGTQITVLDLNAQRLAFCREKMGVHHTIQLSGGGGDSGGAHVEQMKQITAGAMYPIVIDATGHNKSMSDAIGYLAHTGRLVYVGITTSEISFTHPMMHRREATLLASRNALPRDFGRIIRLIEEGQIDTRPWITHRSDFDGLIDRFESFTRPETGVIKAMVEVV